MDRLEFRRRLLMAGPVLVPVSMAGAFTVLSRLLGPRRGYNAGFALYWAGWCFAFPLWATGGKRRLHLLADAARLSGVDAVSLIVPLAGAVATELIPNRRAIDLKVAGVMAGSAVVNAVGEELLWRGTYLEAFPDDAWRGAIWPLAGFTLWHLAPQIIFPSRAWAHQLPRGSGAGRSGFGPRDLEVAWPAMDAGSAHPHRRVRSPGSPFPPRAN